MAKRKATKSQELPQFPCGLVACHISLKRPWRGLQLCFRCHFNQRFAHKIMGLQSRGNPGTKWHLGDGLMAKHKVYYKGEGGGFPQVRATVSPMSPCTKMLQLRTNQLVVWFMQAHVSNWITCQSSYSHLGALARPSTPKVLWARERAPTFFPFVIFSFGLAVESIKELGGASWKLLHCLFHTSYTYLWANHVTIIIMFRTSLYNWDILKIQRGKIFKH
jgi:hypothetical protein